MDDNNLLNRDVDKEIMALSPQTALVEHSDEENLVDDPGALVAEVKAKQAEKRKEQDVPKYSWTTDATEALVDEWILNPILGGYRFGVRRLEGFFDRRSRPSNNFLVSSVQRLSGVRVQKTIFTAVRVQQTIICLVSSYRQLHFDVEDFYISHPSPTPSFSVHLFFDLASSFCMEYTASASTTLTSAILGRKRSYLSTSTHLNEVMMFCIVT